MTATIEKGHVCRSAEIETRWSSFKQHSGVYECAKCGAVWRVEYDAEKKVSGIFKNGAKQRLLADEASEVKRNSRVGAAGKRRIKQ